METPASIKSHGSSLFVSISPVYSSIVTPQSAKACCHASQFLDWLPWADDHVDLAGKTHEERVEYLRSTFNWDRGDVDEDVLACLTRQYGAEFAKNVRFAESW